MQAGLLSTGETLEVGDGEVLRVGEVQQRNWSRIAPATTVGGAGPAYFLKQFVAADGSVLGRGLEEERDAARIGRDVIGDAVIVPASEVESRAVLVYPYQQMTTTDDLLRADPQRLDDVWDAFCADLRAVLDACVHADLAILDGLRDRRRDSMEDLPRILTFKALEVRNIAPAVPGVQPLRIFDLGPPSVATAADAAARLLVSVLLLNWGRPMSRFVRGPATALADRAATAWAPYVVGDVVLAELTKEVRMRSRAIQASGVAQRAAKGAGLATVGRGYAARARRWVRMSLL